MIKDNKRYSRNCAQHSRRPRNKWQWKHDDPKPMVCSQSSFKREVYSYISLPQETRKISNKKSNLTHKGTRERTNKTQS